MMTVTYTYVGGGLYLRIRSELLPVKVILQHYLKLCQTQKVSTDKIKYAIKINGANKNTHSL